MGPGGGGAVAGWGLYLGKRLRTPPPGLITVNSPLTLHYVWMKHEKTRLKNGKISTNAQCLNEKLASTRSTVKFPSGWGRE